MKTSQELVAEAKLHIKEIDVATLSGALADHHCILIDIREPEEFQAGHIDRAVNYPRGVLEMRIHQHPEMSHHCDTLPALEELASRPIYLICRSGARSALAAESLQKMGFEDVYSVAGGFQAWVAAGLPSEV